MDGFMSRVLAAIEDDGARAFRVFPRDSGVLLAFAERIANDVVSWQSYSYLILYDRAVLMLVLSTHRTFPYNT